MGRKTEIAEDLAIGIGTSIIAFGYGQIMTSSNVGLTFAFASGAGLLFAANAILKKTSSRALCTGFACGAFLIATATPSLSDTLAVPLSPEQLEQIKAGTITRSEVLAAADEAINEVFVAKVPELAPSPEEPR